MNNSELIEYNLSKISEVDKEIKKNNEEKNKIIDYYNKRCNKCIFLEKLLSKKTQGIFILITTIVVFLLVVNPFYSVLISLNIISLVNLVIDMFISIFETEDTDIEILEKYEKINEELIIKRNSYINLYNYCMYGENALYNNIKLRINNEKFYEYDKYIPSLNLDKDSYEINTLNQMSYKEELLRKSIKNKVYWELNFSVKSEKLTDEQLKRIYLAL